LDIDPVEMMQTFSPLFVVTTDASGVILPETQVWLTGADTETIITTTSSGPGAFLRAPAGQYTLSAAHPKYSTKSQEITLKTSSILQGPNSENVVLVQFGD
jgi:hypothetical protein